MKDCKNFIQFLGTSGGRHVMASQLRSSAGTFIHIKGKNIIFDPGPGTLVKCVSANPPVDLSKIDAIILSHNHIDHSNDLNVIIDVITEGGWRKKKPDLFAPAECIDGENKVLFNYLKRHVKINILKACSNYAIGNLKFSTSVAHKHGVECYGIKFDVNGQKLAFIVDTKYFPELIESYKGAEILVINLVMYKNNGKTMHLCLDDTREILSKIKPRKVVITHFGRTILKFMPDKIAEKLGKETNTDVIAAEDGMILNLDELKKEVQTKLLKFK